MLAIGFPRVVVEDIVFTNGLVKGLLYRLFPILSLRQKAFWLEILK